MLEAANMLRPELDTSNSLLPGIVLINKKKYAVNLLWNDVPDDKQYKTIIKNRLKLLGSDLYAISRNLAGRQYAIADRNAGHRKSDYVLASCVDNNGRSLCALCKYENIWILLAIDSNGGVIIDKASYEQNEIIQTFYSIYSQSHWDDVVCPVELGIPDSSEQPLYSFINKKGVRLCTTGIERLYPLVALGSVCIGCALFAVVFNGVITSEENTPAITVDSTAPEEVDVPWGGHSLPYEFVKLCVDNVSSKYLKSSSIPGWNVDPVVICDDGGKIFLTVKKDFGLRIWITNGIYKQFFTGELPKIENVKDTSADISWVLNPEKYETMKLQPTQILSELEPIDDIKKYIQDTFEYYFVPLQLEPEQTDSGNIKRINFRISLQNEPTMILPILSKIKNLVIEKCIFNADSGTWEVKGTFWGK
ncbi:hypothetical protein K3E25_004514 [Escherichia coli]|uniref:hypothetical protein n=1 Tax=Escherichia coli TaxID=562 RepID=UPI00107BF450|nr:hypothetical protein [Escherichia coli]EAB0668869.1 hypothetical protein [Escherichia coli]EEW7009087.1 hypothetical protein [Escherichia coli]EEX8182308.1 hypothetical protein [Escherichia coli]EFB9251324.1 hypothetical protein [Escherichia coli]EFF2149102.1 hypothetical protein [Escherichia coli]